MSGRLRGASSPAGVRSAKPPDRLLGRWFGPSRYGFTARTVQRGQRVVDGLDGDDAHVTRVGTSGLGFALRNEHECGSVLARGNRLLLDAADHEDMPVVHDRSSDGHALS